MRTIKRHVIREFQDFEESAVGPGVLTGAALVNAIAEAKSMLDILSLLGKGEHNDCRWTKAGRCVYCVDHNVRLFNGDLPPEKR